VDNQSIQDGHVLINKVLQEYRNKKLTGLMACIDFSGAFDSVKQDFIWKALVRYNVGPQLIHYLKTLYFNAQSAVMNFGTKLAGINFSAAAARVTRLSLTCLSLYLRSYSPLIGEKFAVRSTTYADDMTPFARNVHDLKRIIDTINEFSPIAGLRINISKDANAMKTRNWEKVQDKAKNLFNAWSGRRLTIIGKANVLRAHIQTLIIFTANTSSIPLDIEKQIITAQSKFLWNGPDKEKTSLMHKRLEEGGLNIYI
jgi:hypothetical protein